MSGTGLGKFTLAEWQFIALVNAVIEAFLYGVYSAMFWMYIRYHASKEPGTIDKRNILLYALCILYILSTAIFILDLTGCIVTQALSPSKPDLFRLQALNYTSTTVNALCDFISQGILIYRCWVIWGRNIRLIIIPSILALAFLATWLALNGSFFIDPLRGIQLTLSGYILSLTALGISLTVNAVVTGLIVVRILKVYKEVKLTFKYRTLASGGAKLRSIMLIMVESGMAMFTIQLIRVVIYVLQIDAYYIFVGINEIFNGITPTIILLRVRMGLSFYNQQSMEETIESLRFQAAFQNENPISEPGDIEIAPGQERVDCIGIQTSDDIEIVDRCPT